MQQSWAYFDKHNIKIVNVIIVSSHFSAWGRFLKKILPWGIIFSLCFGDDDKNLDWREIKPLGSIEVWKGCIETKEKSMHAPSASVLLF